MTKTNNPEIAGDIKMLTQNLWVIFALISFLTNCSHTISHKSSWQGLEDVQETKCTPMNLGEKYIYPETITSNYKKNLIIQTVKRNGQPTLISTSINSDLSLSKPTEISPLDGTWEMFSNSKNIKQYYRANQKKIEKLSLQNKSIQQWENKLSDTEEIIEIGNNLWLIHKDDKLDHYRLSFISQNKTTTTSFDSLDYPKTISNHLGEIQYFYGKNKNGFHVISTETKPLLFKLVLNKTSKIESYTLTKRNLHDFHLFYTEGDSMVGNIQIKYKKTIPKADVLITLNQDSLPLEDTHVGQPFWVQGSKTTLKTYMSTWVDAESTFGSYMIKENKIIKGQSVGVFKENTSFHQLIKKEDSLIAIMKTLAKNGTPKHLICHLAL